MHCARTFAAPASRRAFTLVRRFSALPASVPEGVTLVEDAAAAERAIAIMRKLPAGTFHAWDTEVIGIDLSEQSPVGNGTVICASVYSGPNVDYGNGPGLWISNLDSADGLLLRFKEVLEDRAISKVWHNYGFDRHVLYNHGIDARGFAADTMHMARLWDTSRTMRGGYSLEGLTADLLSVKKVPMTELFARPKLKKVH